MKKFIAVIMIAMMLLSSQILAIAEEITEEAVAAPAEVKEEVKEEAPVAEEAKEAAPAVEEAKEEVPAEPAPVEEVKEEAPAAEEAEEEAPVEEVTEEKAEEAVPAEETGEEAPAEEGTEETEEQPEEDSMAVIEQPEDSEEEFTGSLSVSLDFEGEELYYGDTVTLRANVSNANLSYSIRWEAKDGSEWNKIGSGSSYSFTVTEESAARSYRAVLVVE